ncbi:MAG: cupin domain-containing protein [Myxococcales bacterium]|nr:cupin domain-containing protein [Myxococcales bacterium]
MMAVPDDFDGLLAEYLLGTLSDDERAHVSNLLSGSAEAKARLEVARSRLAEPLLVEGWTGFNAVAAWLEGGRRFEHLVPRLAELFDLSETNARALADTIDDDDVWEDGPADGIEVMRVEAGPRCAGSTSSLVRLQPGATMRAPSDGRVLLLEGSYRDDQGVEFWRGRVDERPAGSTHTLTALAGPACLCAIVTRSEEGA